MLDDSLAHRVLALVARFTVLAIFSVGTGATGLIPQMHREFVLRDHWLDETSFSQLLAVSQITPGPNFLIVSLIGWKIASWPGAFATMLSFLLIPNLIAYRIGRLTHQNDSPVLATIRRAVRPMTVALWIGTGSVIAMVNDKTPAALIVTGVAAVGSLFFDLNPILWCVFAGLAGALFF
jgi:chromate transporter